MAETRRAELLILLATPAREPVYSTRTHRGLPDMTDAESRKLIIACPMSQKQGQYWVVQKSAIHNWLSNRWTTAEAIGVHEADGK